MLVAHDAISLFLGCLRDLYLVVAAASSLQDVPRNIIYMLEGSLLCGGLF